MTEPANSTGYFQSRLRRQSRPGAFAIVSAVFLHAAALGGAAYARNGRSEFDDFKVYRVKVYSPPPQVEGPPQPLPPITQPAPAAPEPKAKTVEAPKPEPPKPEPPKPKPEPVKPKPEPAKPQPKPAPKPAESKPAESKPAESKPTPAKQPAPARPGSASNAPSKPVVGPNARADSPGGENIDVDIDGAEFPFPAYLENVITQMSRYFRWTGACNLRARVGFYIREDGSVMSPRVLQSSGDREFDRAVLRGIDMISKSKAFGPLPDAFVQDRLAVSYTFDPPCQNR